MIVTLTSLAALFGVTVIVGAFANSLFIVNVTSFLALYLSVIDAVYVPFSLAVYGEATSFPFTISCPLVTPIVTFVFTTWLFTTFGIVVNLGFATTTTVTLVLLPALSLAVTSYVPTVDNSTSFVADVTSSLPSTLYTID